MTDSTENANPAPCSKEPCVGAQISLDDCESPGNSFSGMRPDEGVEVIQELSADAIPVCQPGTALSSEAPGAVPLDSDSPHVSSISKVGGELLERGAVVTARGTGEGLVLRLDGRAERNALEAALTSFMEARRTFLGGQAVCLEWVGVKPEDVQVEEIKQILREKFDVSVKVSRLYERGKVAVVEKHGLEAQDVSRTANGHSKTAGDSTVGESQSPEGAYRFERPPSLFDGMQALARDLEAPGPATVKTSFGAKDAAALWDDADCRVIYATLRSGQRVESEHSVVVFGDVNSGAEVIAGGDIIVLGTLRGIAHAGAYDESGGGRVIFALNFQPTQLRIGSIISRGAPESRNRPEIARVDGTLIVVEPYQARGVVWRRGK